MLIGELAKRTGLSRDTIRYYKRLELLVAEDRNAENDYKNYGSGALRRLEHIQQLKLSGFTLREMRDLLIRVESVHPCAALPTRLAQKLEDMDKQIATLVEYRNSLRAMQEACNGACGCSEGIPTCVPLSRPAPLSSKCC